MESIMPSIPPQSRKIESGFTLVELLVVIAIIAILTAIAIPMFLSQREKSRDAALRSDLKNVAITVAGENIAAPDYYALFNASTAWVGGQDSTPMREEYSWNDKPSLPKLSVSDTSLIEIVVSNITGTTSWAVPHEPGEFCLTGTSQSSSYKYVPGSGDVSKYTGYLFYDTKLGGIVELHDIIDAVKGKTGQEAALVSSCHGYGLRYIDTIGSE